MALLFKPGDPRNIPTWKRASKAAVKAAAAKRKDKRKPGSKPKDELLTTTINPKKRGASSRVAKLATQEAKAELKRIADAEKQRLAEEEAEAQEDEPPPKKAKSTGLKFDTAGDSKSAYQMLMDIRYAYRNSIGPGGKTGRGRLVELMKSDADFKFIVKELLKVEMALKKAEIDGAGKRGGDGGSNQNFFVILKGLETEKDVMRLAMGADKDNVVDMKQIRHAIDPEERGGYEAEEVSRTAAPEQLMRGAGGEEEEETEEEEAEEELADELIAAEGIDAW